MTALVVDIGRAYLVQRQLQASVDAAALAGAQHLPDPSESILVAHAYGPGTGGKNEVKTGTEVSVTVNTRCLQSAPGCRAGFANYNALNVKASSDVGMSFARIIGINKLKVRAQATACSPCTSKPLDIMLVIDRTGSMCRTGSGGYERPLCPDLTNAKNGMRTFLSFMDPSLDYVGLALTPPVLDASWRTSCPSPNGYLPWTGTSNNPNVSGGPLENINGRFYGIDAYWPDVAHFGGPNAGWPQWTVHPSGATPSLYTVASLENNYQRFNTQIGPVGGEPAVRPHPAHRLRRRRGKHDVRARHRGGSARARLPRPRERPGRHHHPRGRRGELHADERRDEPLDEQPDQPGASRAGAPSSPPSDSRTGATIVYTIGYDLDAGTGAWERCLSPDANGHQRASTPANYEQCGSWGCTAFDMMRAMATPTPGPNPYGNFYNKPDPGSLNLIFTRIAADLAKPAARLIDDNAV